MGGFPHNVSLALTPIDQPNTKKDAAYHPSDGKGLSVPNGIAVARLEAINVELRLATLCYTESTHPRPTASSSLTINDDLARQMVTTPASAEIETIVQESSIKPEVTQDGLHLMEAPSPATPGNEMVEDDRSDWMLDVAESSQDSVIWSHDSQQTLSSISSFSGDASQPNDTTMTAGTPGKSCKLEDLSRLADVALRTITGGAATLTTAGIVLSDDSGGPKLAEIAPAVFSPGYAAVTPSFRVRWAYI